MQSSPLPENPIPAKKKKRFQLRRREWCKHLTPIASSNRCAYRKSNSNTAAARFLLQAIATETNAEVDAEIGPPVTTSHLFWPNQQRRTTSLLPIWLRNSDIIGRQYDQEAERGGRGGSAGRNRQGALIHKLTWNFIANGSPALFCGLKNSADRQRRRPVPTSAPAVSTIP